MHSTMVDSTTQTKETISDLDNSPFLKKIVYRQALKDEVLKLTRPYRLSQEEPPFEIEELIVFALVSNAKETWAEDEIHHWIIKTFPYFNNLAIAYYLKSVVHIGYREDCEPPEHEIVEWLPDALKDFDLALEVQFDNDSRKRLYSITTGAARICLRDRLRPKPKGIFPFLKLAPELRNRVYEMLFKYPASGIYMGGNLEHHAAVPSQSTAINNLADALSSEPQTEADDLNYVVPERFSTTLAILRTCKQVHNEASPMFYALNKFVFVVGHGHDAEWYLRRLAPIRVKHLRNIHLHFDVLERDGRSFEATFQRLSEMSLDSLTFSMDSDTETHWLSEFRTRGQGRWTKNKFYKRRLWIMIGAAMKAKKIEVHGDCPAFKSFMRSKVQVDNLDYVEGSPDS